MPSIVDRYRHIWGNNPSSLLDEYRYQPELTPKLDALAREAFDLEAFYEIVLWKVNRYARPGAGLLASLKSVAELEPKEHGRAEPQLRELLHCKGVRLPLASTVLRFLNPEVFQIIDERAYRMLLPGRKIPSKPRVITEGYLTRSVTTYFDYLDELHKECGPNLPFSQADRILYQLDKKLGNPLGRSCEELP